MAQLRAKDWLERWLLANDVPHERLADTARAVRARASKFPFPVNTAWPRMTSWLDRVGPALLLKTLKPARKLDGEAFERLERALVHHPSVYVRALYTLARYPGLETIYPDHAPPTPAHPLDALEEQIRLGTALGNDVFDVVVIGTGAGGAPVAWSLSRAGFRVAMVEAGRRVASETYNEAIRKHYLDQGMIGSAVDGGTALVMAASAVGGTTVVNSGTSLRPLGECLSTWDAESGTDFANGTLEPWLDAASEKVGVTVLSRELLDGSAEVIERGLKALGREGLHVLPRNAPACEGSGRCCFGCPTGAKLSTDRAFLPEAIEQGAALFAETRATEIRETADGVEVFVRGTGTARTLRARHLVIAGGALNTPGILRSNRLGTRWRQAGQHLRMHPASKAFGLMPGGLDQHGIPQGVGYKDPGLPRITFEGIHTPAGAAAPMVMAAGRRHRFWMENYHRLATYGMMCRDRGTGWVRDVGSGNRFMHYGLHPEDARDIGAGLLLLAEAFFAAGAERVLLPVNGMDPEVADLDALHKLRPEDFTPQRLTTAGFHPQGTAGIGRLVDTDLRLIGCDRISVCDASVMPNSPGVNPQITIMALSLRLADHLQERL